MTQRARWPWAVLAGVLALTAAARWRLLDTPLERDEGEYAYAAQLMLQGVPPYQLACNMKFPGTYGAYAAIMAVFGQTPRGIHIGLLLTSAASIVLVYLLARRVLRGDDWAALVSAGAFALLSTGAGVLGFAAHATQFIVPLAIGGLLALETALERRRYALIPLAGLLLGTAILMKQHAAAFALLAALRVLQHGLGESPRRWPVLARALGGLAAGALAPLGIVMLLLWQAGVLASFWFWTVTYASRYATMIPIDEAPARFWEGFKPVLADAPLLWLAAAVGLIALGTPTMRRARALPAGLLVCSLLAVLPGFYFRQHYFIVMLPAVALLCGVAVSAMSKALPSRYSTLPTALAIGALLVSAIAQTPYLLRLSPAQIVRDAYWPNPFVESERIAEFIRENTQPDDTIAVLGSEPQIPFYAHRRSVSPFLYVYPLMEEHDLAEQMQRQMIADIERARPRVIVLVAVGSSWLRRPGSANLVLEWFDAYGPARYDMAGLVDIMPAESVYTWGPQAGGTPPRSPHYVRILLRRDDPPPAAVQ
jgi:hypothetical protein